MRLAVINAINKDYEINKQNHKLFPINANKTNLVVFLDDKGGMWGPHNSLGPARPPCCQLWLINVPPAPPFTLGPLLEASLLEVSQDLILDSLDIHTGGVTSN